MATFSWQTWNSAPFSIERKQGTTPGTLILSFHGPFTVRDAYSRFDPQTISNMLSIEPAPGDASTRICILDLTDCPTMDSSGLGLIVTHHVRCQKKGVVLIAAAMGPRVRQLFNLTKVDTLFPIATSLEIAEQF